MARLAGNPVGGFLHGGVRNSQATGRRQCSQWTALPVRSEPSGDSPPPGPHPTGGLGLGVGVGVNEVRSDSQHNTLTVNSLII